MDNQEKIVIKLEDLPVRAEKLSFEEVSEVFGGCLADGAKCEKYAGECCNNCLTLLPCEGTCGIDDSGAIWV